MTRALIGFVCLAAAASAPAASHANDDLRLPEAGQRAGLPEQTSYLAQNIFDDDATETPKATPEVKPAKKPVKTGDENSAAKTGKKKKKGKKRKKSAAKEAVTAGGTSYSPEELARASYTWAPETGTVALTTMAPGMKSQGTVAAKPVAVAMNPETVEEKPPQQGGGFKLPQIPLAQVLIVAGFVILFLIYRFRVGRQIKRKKY